MVDGGRGYAINHQPTSSTTLPPLFAQLTEIADAEPYGAALNMALDEVLLRSAHEPLVRIYRWAQPAVSFGYFGKFADVERAWPEREIVRRWTGGGAVPHGDDLTYTLIVPRAHAFARLAARESYRLIHERIAALLGAAGQSVAVAPHAHAPVSNACFENAVEFDVLAAEGKVAGAAQRRTQWGLLHQGSIQGLALPESVPRQLASFLGREVARGAISTEQMTAASELAAEKYATAAWLKRF